MKQGILKALLAWIGAYGRAFKKQRAGLLHLVQQAFVAPDPGDVAGPAAALDVKAMPFPRELGEHCGEPLGARTRPQPIPDPLLMEGLERGQVLRKDAQIAQEI